jgi:hypothetical protein
MIIKFFSHLNQSLSKLKSTKFAPPLWAFSSGSGGASGKGRGGRGGRGKKMAI